MKKLFLITGLAAMMAGPVMAQYSPTASTKVYSFTNIGDEVLDVFYTALQNGHKYPTEAEFRAAGYDMMDIAFIRSHVRPRQIMVDHSKDINSSVQEGRKLWMNIPIGVGKEQGGFPSSNFGDDTFTGWNYTNVFGTWNHPLFRAPAVAVDCAHKNGADMYSGIKFFDTTGGRGEGANYWMKIITTKDASGYGGYKYVEPLINALMYFGSDGINYNWEDSGFGDSDIVGFHQACYRLAKERGFDNFHIGIYTSASQLTASNCRALLGNKATGKTADAFLNYAASDFASTIDLSAQTAITQFGSADGVYQGTWIVGMNRTWSNLVKNDNAKKVGVVLWGEHAQSRIYSYNQGNDAIDFQENYQKLQERFFSGGYRNPALRPTATNSANWQTEDPSTTGLQDFQGLAEYIPERTAIQQNLPFTTYFNTGSGDRYNYRGKRTAGPWYNLGQQDVVPTYRWLVYKTRTTTALKEGLPEWTSADAYIGGACLRLTGTVAQDIVLYRTNLTVSGSAPQATIALKRYEGAPAGTVSVIVKKKGSNTWQPTNFANVKGNTWEEQTLPLNGISQGDVIEYIGLRTSGNVNGLLIGELSLNDNSVATPASVRNLEVEVKEESQVSMSFKMRWDVDATANTRAAYGLLYNDEANIDHFEVFYKKGEKGRIYEVGRTTAWSHYVGNIPMDTDDKPFIGVRAASTDGKTYSDIVWTPVARAAASQLPESAAALGDYPTIIIDQNSDNWETALNQRWLSRLQTTGASKNINISCSANPAKDTYNYWLADSQGAIKAGQGQKITLTWTDARNGDGLNYCTGRGYADWDGDHLFNAGTDELIWSLGESNSKKANSALTQSYSLQFTIPSDAVVGESRIRLVFSDAWFPHPGPTGVTNKGFSVDIPLEITGTNPGRQPAVDKHDPGDADEPDGIQPPYTLGDVNNDGDINVGDLTALVAFILGNPAEGHIREAADLNEDGEINVTDYTLLVSLILNGGTAKVSPLTPTFVPKAQVWAPLRVARLQR